MPGFGSFCSGNGGLGSDSICGFAMPPKDAISGPASNVELIGRHDDRFWFTAEDPARQLKTIDQRTRPDARAVLVEDGPVERIFDANRPVHRPAPVLAPLPAPMFRTPDRERALLCLTNRRRHRVVRARARRR